MAVFSSTSTSSFLGNPSSELRACSRLKYRLKYVENFGYYERILSISGGV
jgi:hypothetical protein